MNPWLRNRAFFRCFNLAGEQAEAFYDRLAEVGSGEVSHSLFAEALNDCFVREPDYGSFRIPKKKELPQAPALDEEAPEEPAWSRLRTYQPAEESTDLIFVIFALGDAVQFQANRGQQAPQGTPRGDARYRPQSSDEL